MQRRFFIPGCGAAAQSLRVARTAGSGRPAAPASAGSGVTPPRIGGADDRDHIGVVFRWLSRVCGDDPLVVAGRLSNIIERLKPMSSAAPELREPRALLGFAAFLVYAESTGLSPLELHALIDTPAWMRSSRRVMLLLQRVWSADDADRSFMHAMSA